jgi:hypothetical protein
VIIVENKQDLDYTLSKVMCDPFIMDIVSMNDDLHAANNSISLILFKFIKSGEIICLPVNHHETICIPNVLLLFKDALKMSIARKMVVDKKSIVQLLGGDYGFIDTDIIRYLVDCTPADNDVSVTNAHFFIRTQFNNVKDINRSIPVYKHIKLFEEKMSKIVIPTDQEIQEKGFVFMNDMMTNCFAKLELNGLCVNKDIFFNSFGDEQARHVKGNIVFSQYNFFTSTGRPSNRFGGVNFAALNKTDGSRKSFISRFGKEGMLVMMDFNSFHPRLIAHLANFELPGNINPYEYLSKYYFEKEFIDEEDIAVAKGLTFPQLYGSIEKRWLHIPYFEKVQDYIDHRWKFFNIHGYIETPIYLRKINSCHIIDPTPNKLFNYILQAFETEMAVGTLNEIQSYLEGKKSVPILYTYDSILFDIHKSDGMDTIQKLKKIMEGGKFPVKVYVGKSYFDMRKVDIN